MSGQLQHFKTFEVNERIINDRQKGIDDVEEIMLEVNKGYKDMALNVGEQGETIDQMMNNLEVADNNVVKANV